MPALIFWEAYKGDEPMACPYCKEMQTTGEFFERRRGCNCGFWIFGSKNIQDPNNIFYRYSAAGRNNFIINTPFGGESICIKGPGGMRKEISPGMVLSENVMDVFRNIEKLFLL